MRQLRAAWHWCFGELHEPEELLRDRLLLHALGVAVCLALLGGMRLRISGDLLLRGAWRSGMYGGVPVAVLALWWAWRQRRLDAGLLGLGGGVCASVPWLALMQGKEVYAGLGGTGTACVLLGYALGYASMLRGGLALDRFGLGLGDWRWWLPRTALGVVLLALGGALLVETSASMLRFYPPFMSARTDGTGLGLHLAGLTLDIYGWELMFRGLLLWVFALRGDVRGAIEAQAIVFFLGHLDKPLVECLVSLPGGVLAGMFAWRARSFVPIFVLHTAQLWAVNIAGYLHHLG